MARTFTVEGGSIRAKANFDDVVWFVHVAPEEVARADGSTAVRVGFPVCAVTGWVAQDEEFAGLIARLLTEHFAKEPAA